MAGPAAACGLAGRAQWPTGWGRVRAALADSRRRVVLRADHAGTWFNHGFMLEAAGELAEAETAFRQATSLGPELDRGASAIQHRRRWAELLRSA